MSAAPLRRPAAYLVTWPTGNQTAIAGRSPPSFGRGVKLDALFLEPCLIGFDRPDLEAAAQALCQRLYGSPLREQTPNDADLCRELARVAIESAFPST